MKSGDRIGAMILYTTDITKLIFDNLGKVNDNEAIRSVGGEKIGGEELSKEILSLAKNLSLYGIKKGDRIAVLINDNIFFVKIIIAVYLCGASIVLLDPAMGGLLMKEKIYAANVKYIFIEGWIYDALIISGFGLKNQGIDFIIHGMSVTGFFRKNTENLFCENDDKIQFEYLDEYAECMVVFTGGTTGDPVGVIHTVSSILAMAQKIKGLIYNSHIFYADMPHFLLLGLLMGVKIIAGQADMAPKKFFQILKKYKVDTYFSPPYKYYYAIENNINLPVSMTNILLGSAPVHISFLKRFEKIAGHVPHITCIYGMTELLPIASIDAREKIQKNYPTDLLGYILPGIDYTIIDDELLLKHTKSVGSYLGREASSYIFTGDLVFLDRNMLIMKGRKKDMIIRKDYNIYPGLYEPIIMRIPGILEVALIGIYDEHTLDEKIILFIEIMENSRVYSQKELLLLLTSGEYSIDKYALPDEIIFTKLPRKGRQNKIDKEKLRNIYLSN